MIDPDGIWQCKHCDWTGKQAEFLVSQNPFDEAETIHGCPACFSIDSFGLLCDVPECGRKGDCGWPTTDGGYRHTCHVHMEMKT